jgi:iron complex outermembrane receptor protein
MHGFVPILRPVLIAAALVFSSPAISFAEDQTEKGETPGEFKKKGKPKSKSGEDAELIEEFSTLEDADYPDLVAANDESEIIDEFTLLMEDAGVVESAARHRQEIGMSPSAITVITREDIEASGAENIGDLLRMVPGMEVLITGELFTSLTARMYLNVENHHFLLLIDGRDASDELIGATFLHIQPVGLDDVERIEVIRGPGSSLYGANAQAGVISITTRALSEETSGSARVVAGEPGMIAANARASTWVSDWGFSINTGAEISGKYWASAEPGREIWRLRGVVERRLAGESHVLLEGGFTSGAGIMGSTLGALDAEQQLGAFRLLYKSEDIRAQLYWVLNHVTGSVEGDLVFSGIRLAKLQPIDVRGHIVDGDFQWTIPTFYDPLMLIVGGRVRVSTLTTEDMLDPSYADITSSSYHKPGITHWEERAGAFVHGELAPADWVTLTAGIRLDYNTVSGEFLSPRLAAVFRPVAGQFFRVGAARAFRKPAFQETHTHLKAVFPDDSPITGPAQENFQEFMARAIGNRDLENEKLWSLEAAYLGQFLEGHLSVAVDLYYNYHTDLIDFESRLVPDEQGLPDLMVSEIKFVNIETNLNIVGGELCIRFNPTKYVFLLASWAHREVLENDTSPKNLITLGGRFTTDFGLLGSLYVFSRSEYMDRGVENPEGMMAPELAHHQDNVMLILAKLGWKWKTQKGLAMETGVKLFLPFSPFSGPLFSYYERSGGFTPEGRHYGGTKLSRALTAYLQGSF